MINKKQMYLIAQGKIESPLIEISANGESMIFKEHEARCFAIGYLTGKRDTEKNDIDFKTSITG